MSTDSTGSGPALGMEHVSVHFRQKAGTVKAVDDVSLSVGTGEIVGLVGESGSGKSTLARCAVRLLEPTAGTVRLLGDDVTHLRHRRMRPLRRRVHMVFQDSYSAMNPRMKIGDVVAEPLRQHRVGSRQERRDRVVEMLTRVGLRADHATRSPHELSGGQRQRIGIARALILEPELLVADEPVSALDVSIQAAILNLLADLQRELGFSCLFITHDLSVVEHVSDRIAVMYLGRVVEQATREQLFARPEHPYTQALMSAAPYPDPVRQRARRQVVLSGDIPSPLDPPVGCGFHSRCPLVVDDCATVLPDLAEGDSSGHLVRCLRYEPGAGVPRLEEAP